MPAASETRIEIGTAVTALKSAADQTRLRILLLLAAGELNVKDLTRILGQQIVVDLVRDVLRIPKRGILVWRGVPNDADLEHILVSLHQPATPRELPPRVRPPLSVFFV